MVLFLRKLLLPMAISAAVVLARPMQSFAQAVAWEPVGALPVEPSGGLSLGLFFHAGPAPDGSQDTLYAAGDGVFRFVPGAGDWELLCSQSICNSDEIIVTDEGYILIGSRTGPASGGERSTDGGTTWENNVIGHSVATLTYGRIPTLDGTIFAGGGYIMYRSTMGGERGSWTASETMGGEPVSVAEVQPSDSLPDGRLVAGIWNGVIYSDDGGQTWQQSNLYSAGTFIGHSVTFSPDAALEFGGVVYAGVTNFQTFVPALYRSDDGGATFTMMREFLPGDFGVSKPEWIVLQAGVKRSLYVGIEHVPGGNVPSEGAVVATLNHGQTWISVGDSTNGWPGYGPLVMRLARDGRLYSGTDRGVWRTVDAVPVSVESGGEAQEPEDQLEHGATLEVAPNPFADQTNVVLTLEHQSRVRLSIFDLLGREVGVLAERVFPAGEHAISTSGVHIPVGVSFVRATMTSNATPGRGTKVISTQLTRLR